MILLLLLVEVMVLGLFYCIHLLLLIMLIYSILKKYVGFVEIL